MAEPVMVVPRDGAGVSYRLLEYPHYAYIERALITLALAGGTMEANTVGEAAKAGTAMAMAAIEALNVLKKAQIFTKE